MAGKSWRAKVLVKLVAQNTQEKAEVVPGAAAAVNRGRTGPVL